MTRPGATPTGPPLGEPVEVAGDKTWDLVRADLARHGTALVYAELGDLQPDLPAAHELRAVLGRDWSRYLDLAHPSVRDRYAASRVLLKRAGAAVLRADPDTLELGYGPTGRPYLRGCDQVDISLSHTDDLLLVGLTTRGLIGVDAERADRPMYGRGLGRHVCTPYELVSLAALPEQDRNPSLVRLWTLKEAYSKAIGQGMQFSFTEFGFGPDGKPVRVHRPDGSPGTGEEWAFRTFLLDNGYRISAAVYDAGFGELDDAELTSMLDRDTVEAITDALGTGD
ncbi:MULTISPECIES: 4'-phosphopantetheinyl transferase superfamily protein [unclassified Kitasatospora]|uniref:4'-phosphopantetheinyl transferase family protein n=1 Tax=unclassified Kitasatospora TaxID=2633591 RepID=UPI00070B05E5|nr:MULTISPECIES: 4'-phosphopantetheinyl transferase superfamily protein [unclassified Kitasatospora]KQV20073.1 phosphopantetheinyl transferase [Kitasatospora sp. Root107]KRB71198.1 phosphopantetheinyl transferase [Kitasatospora sp. Root187]